MAKRDAADILSEEGPDALRAAFDQDVAAQRKAKANGASTSRFPLIPFHELRPGKKRTGLIKGLVPCVGIVLVWGPPKCGKSFWTFDLMMHVALGWKYRDRRVQQGTVIYCAFEGAEGFKARAEAFRRKYGITPDTEVPFFLSPVHAKLVRDHKALIASIRVQTAKPAAVVLDTLNKSIEGSESKDEDMGKYLTAADAIHEEFGCVVDIVHHCGVDGSRPRGHTSLTGTADAQLSVRRDSANNVVVEVEYMKDGPEGAQLTSRLEVVTVGTDEDGDEITSCVVVPVEGGAAPNAPKAPKLAAVPALALEKLQELIAESGEPAPTSNHIPTGVKVCSASAWRDMFYLSRIRDKKAEGDIKGDTNKKAFNRAVERLQELHLIGIWSDLVWLAGQAGHQGDKRKNVP